MTSTDATTLAEATIPTDLGETLQRTFGLDEPPRTLDDWLTATSSRLDAGLSIGVEDLCTAAESRHVATVDGDERHFHCVLDALLLPFLRPDAAPVEIRSESPRTGYVVEIALASDSVTVAPPDAVLSFGLATETAIPDPADVDVATAYQSICPYINAFPSRQAYARWARTTPEASTMATSIPTGLELAWRLVDATAVEPE